MKRLLVVMILIFNTVWGMKEWPQELGDGRDGCVYEYTRIGNEAQADRCYQSPPDFTRKDKPDLGIEGKDYYKIKGKKAEAIIASVPEWGIFLSNIYPYYSHSDQYYHFIGRYSNIDVGPIIFNDSKVIFVDFPNYKIMAILKPKLSQPEEHYVMFYQIFEMDSKTDKIATQESEETFFGMFPLAEEYYCEEDHSDCVNETFVHQWIEKKGEEFFDKVCADGWFGPFVGCKDGVIQGSDCRYGFCGADTHGILD